MKGKFLGNEYFNVSRVAAKIALVKGSRFIKDGLKQRIGTSLVRTGRLYQSIHIDYITNYRSRIGTDVPYASFHNYGTGVWGRKAKYYIIRAKRAKLLRFFIPKVGWLSVKKVFHPGVKPIMFLEKTVLDYKNNFRI